MAEREELNLLQKLAEHEPKRRTPPCIATFNRLKQTVINDRTFPNIRGALGHSRSHRVTLLDRTSQLETSNPKQD